jgi:hypothetical protein
MVEAYRILACIYSWGDACYEIVVDSCCRTLASRFTVIALGFMPWILAGVYIWGAAASVYVAESEPK